MKRFPLFFQKNSRPQKMEPRNGIIYEFADFRLIPSEGLLLQSGEPISLSLKAFSTLVLLVERHGHLVPKSDLIEEVWENAFVEEAAVSRCVWTIRSALGEDSKSSRFIQTIPRRGYRFVFPVSVVSGNSGAFRLHDVYGHDDLDRALSEEREPASNSATNASLSDVVGESSQSAIEVECLPEPLRVGQRSSLFFPRWTMLVGLVALVVVGTFVGYYGFVRKSAAELPRSMAILRITPIDPAAPKKSGELDGVLEVGIADSLNIYLTSANDFNVKTLSALSAEPAKDPVELGREQGVNYVLSSTYQIADGQIKITSRLHNTTTGQEKTFTSRKTLTGVFDAQDAIAADIGGQLMQFLGTPAKKRATDNEDAYLAYTQGMYLLDRLSPTLRKKETANPLEFFDRALSLDPNYAKALAGKALALNRAAQREDEQSNEYHQKAREAAARALSIDSTESLAHAALCQLLSDEWNFSAAEEEGRRAVELDPQSSFALSEYAVILISRGQFDEAISQLKKALVIEPTSFRAQAFYANALYMARRYEEAEVQYKVLVDLKPDRPATYSWLIRVLEVQGKEAEAFEWTVKHMVGMEKGGEAIQSYKDAYQKSGYKAALRVRIRVDMMPIHAYVQLGNNDKAFEKLEESYTRRSRGLAVWGVWEPLYDPLRTDPRWTNLVRRVRGE